jgi:hypothetical protein
VNFFFFFFVYRWSFFFLFSLRCVALRVILLTHRQPANVMFKRVGSLKICDLGFVEVMGSHAPQRLLMVGTRHAIVIVFLLVFVVGFFN